MANEQMVRIDCVLVGYYDEDFAQVVARVRPTADQSGAYSCLKTNSVLIDGMRLPYTSVINRAIQRATGLPSRLSPFDLPNLACCYLSSYLIRRGLATRMVNFVNHAWEDFGDLLHSGPRVVAISTTFYTHTSPIAEIVRFVRKHDSATTIVVGGPHVFNVCKDCDVESQNEFFDAVGADVYVNDSQGEATLALLVHTLRAGRSLSGVPNLIVAHGGPFRYAYGRTARIPENNDMNECSIDWRAVDSGLFTPATQTRASRGCAFRCSFCMSRDRTGALALTDVAVVERELSHMRDAGVRFLTFVDDTLNIPLPRFKDFLRMMFRNDFGFEWFCNFRPANSDDETFSLMQKSGCKGVFLGIESGDQTVLDHMNKAAKLDQYEYGLSKLHEHHIMSFASLIFGFPGETPRTIESTVRFIEKTAPTFYQASLYYHHPASPIGRDGAKHGIRGCAHSWEHETMSWREAVASIEQAYRSIRNSVVLPLYGFDFFGLPYWFSKGMGIDKMIPVLQICQKMMVAGMADKPVPQFLDDELTALFRPEGTSRSAPARHGAEELP